MQIKAIRNTANTTKKIKSTASNLASSSLKNDVFVQTLKKGTKASLKTTAMAAEVFLLLGVGCFAKDWIDKALNRKHAPEELRILFNNIKKKEGKEFANDAYDGLVKYYNLEGIAPKKVDFDVKEDGLMTILGGFNVLENKIGYSKGFLNKLTKKQQISLISHELKHVKQFNLIMRTQGLGFEALADAWAENALNNAKAANFQNWMQQMQRLHPQEAPKIIAETKQKLKTQYLKALRENYSDVEKMPKISKDSKEGKRAYKYIEAVEKYEGLSFFGVGSEEYENNLIEKEAYAQGDKMAEIFSNFV